MKASSSSASQEVSTLSRNGFTLIELLVVVATLAMLAAVMLPALAGTKSDARAFQCLNNQRQIILGWQMYADDNSGLLPPNDYNYTLQYYTIPAANKIRYKNWVCGTMNQPVDANNKPQFGLGELTDRVGTALALFVTNAAIWHCPADNYIDPQSKTLHPRSYSMNSAVGTLWSYSYTYAPANGFGTGVGPLGAPVQGGWLPGNAYSANQTTWLTYGKMSSFTRPGPANTWILIDDNPYSMNDGLFAASAVAAPGQTYLIDDFASGNHGNAGVLSFTDGHVIVHQWQDARTYAPAGIIQPGMGSQKSTLQSPDDPDCFYLAPITSAPR